MKRNIRFMTLFILAFMACILLTSCQNRTIQEDAETSSSAANPSATEGGTINPPAETEPGHAETTGSSVDASADEDHQITPEDTDAGSFSAGVKSIGQFYEYNGGEMVFEYSVDSMGGLAPDNVGIMVYLNGTPLPFSIEGIDNEEMAYFHILRGVNNQGVLSYWIHCIPYGAVQGEEANVNLLSFQEPEYIYDPASGQVPAEIDHITETPGTSGFLVQFNQSAPGIEERPELDTAPLITNMTIAEDSDQDGFVEEYNATVNADSLPKMTLSGCLESYRHIEYYDGVYYDGSCDFSNEGAYIIGEPCIDGKDTVHLKYRILGKPGTEITLAFTLGTECTPILIDGESSRSFTCEEGKVYTVEADIDVSGISEVTRFRSYIFQDGRALLMQRYTTFYFSAQ